MDAALKKMFTLGKLGDLKLATLEDAGAGYLDSRKPPGALRYCFLSRKKINSHFLPTSRTRSQMVAVDWPTQRSQGAKRAENRQIKQGYCGYFGSAMNSQALRGVPKASKKSWGRGQSPVRLPLKSSAGVHDGLQGFLPNVSRCFGRASARVGNVAPTRYDVPPHSHEVVKMGKSACPGSLS